MYKPEKEISKTLLNLKNSRQVVHANFLLIQFYADLTFVAPMGDAIRRHKGPLYQFLYDYRAGSSLSTSFGNFTDLGNRIVWRYFFFNNLISDFRDDCL